MRRSWNQASRCRPTTTWVPAYWAGALRSVVSFLCRCAIPIPNRRQTPLGILDRPAAWHYRDNELTEEKKAYATIEANTLYLTNHIVPKWGTMYLQDVRTVDVELWLHTLIFAPGTRSKIRNIMSAVFNHAIRHD
jgi:hypothetical protein